MLDCRFALDARVVLGRLAELGSVSAQITTQLRLTRGVVAEALQALRDERRVQCILLVARSASRYRTLTGEGLQDAVCPLSACSERDTAAHMLVCYDLTEKIAYGEAAAPFLVLLARKTQILVPNAPQRYREPRL